MPDLCLESSIIAESLFIAICDPKDKNIIVGHVFCRPPGSNVNIFVQKFDDLL
jgi:hypothetical protein